MQRHAGERKPGAGQLVRTGTSPGRRQQKRPAETPTAVGEARRTQLEATVPRGRISGAWPRMAPYLQHGHLLPIAKQSEGQGMLGVQARDHVTASERNRHDVGLEIGPVLVEDESVVLDSAPALPPAAVGEHVEIACEGPTAGSQHLETKPAPSAARPFPSASSGSPREADSPPQKPPRSCSLRMLSDR